MLGHLMEWFYAGLAGIKQADHSVAYNKIEIKPQPVGDVTAAKAGYHSPYGEIVSDWKKQDNEFELNVEIPANATATVYLPAAKSSVVKANGKILKASYAEGKAIVKIGSGRYSFKVN